MQDMSETYHRCSWRDTHRVPFRHRTDHGSLEHLEVEGDHLEAIDLQAHLETSSIGPWRGLSKVRQDLFERKAFETLNDLRCCDSFEWKQPVVRRLFFVSCELEKQVRDPRMLVGERNPMKRHTVIGIRLGYPTVDLLRERVLVLMP